MNKQNAVAATEPASATPLKMGRGSWLSLLILAAAAPLLIYSLLSRPTPPSLPMCEIPLFPRHPIISGIVNFVLFVVLY
jgi:hypothetical protein